MFEQIISNKKWQAVLILVFWTLVAVISASQLYARFADQYAFGWGNMFLRQLPVWYSWALVTPLILYLTSYISKQVKKASLNILFNVLTALGMVLLYNLVFSAASIIFYENQPSLADKFLTTTLAQSVSNLLVFLLIALFGYAVRWYQAMKEGQVQMLTMEMKQLALKKELSEANLNNLKRQLHPHFLFNAMHTVASLVRTHKNEEAVEVLAKLSKLLRESLKDLNSNVTSLDKELGFIKDYLDIEKTRFSDRLEVDYDIDPAVANAEVPALILQPLMENCLKHGLKDSPQAGVINIAANLVSSSVVLTIRDNGSGYDPGKPEGIGLANVRGRLQNLYPGTHHFEIVANKKGTLVTIQYPYHPYRIKEEEHALREV